METKTMMDNRAVFVLLLGSCMEFSIKSLLLIVLSLVSMAPIASAQSESKYAQELRIKAEAGDADAQYELGRLHDPIFDRHKKQAEFAQALFWYKKAAEQGHVEAQFNLALTYQHGVPPIAPKETKQAHAWYRRLAQQGIAQAQYIIGMLYENGNDEPKDYEAAFIWLQKAAEQGHDMAQNVLGEKYAKGKGVAQNLVLAYMWLNLAASQDWDPAKAARDALEEQMTPTQIAEAQRLSREWKPKKQGK